MRLLILCGYPYFAVAYTLRLLILCGYLYFAVAYTLLLPYFAVVHTSRLPILCGFLYFAVANTHRINQYTLTCKIFETFVNIWPTNSESEWAKSRNTYIFVDILTWSLAYICNTVLWLRIYEEILDIQNAKL